MLAELLAVTHEDLPMYSTCVFFERSIYERDNADTRGRYRPTTEVAF